MPSPITHLVSIIPFFLGFRYLNILTLVLASIFPDIIPLLLAPITIYALSLKGPALNSTFTFFDQTILGGFVSAAILILCILLFMKYFPKISIIFKWKQNHTYKAIIISSLIGVFLHVILDLNIF